MRVAHLTLPVIAAVALSAPPVAAAQGSGGGSGTGSGTVTATPPPGTPPPMTGTTGGAGLGAPPPGPSTPAHPTVPGYVAKIIHGVAYAPSMAPIQVKRAIWAGNKIRRKPYIFGGGHAAFKAAGYDCSGSVSYVLHAAGLLKRPDDSTDFMNWGQTGVGQWITVYTNPGHAFIEIAGIRFDTSAEADPHPPRGSGPRWRPNWMNPQGFMARHPTGF